MDHRVQPTAVRPSGFFVLRTPLLPFDSLLQLSEGLSSYQQWQSGFDLASAVSADSRSLRSRLDQLLRRPEILEAIFVASPDLHSRLDVWRRDPDSRDGQRIERAMTRYLLRMAGRATPFGLLAGVATGVAGTATVLRTPPKAEWVRQCRLDMGYLSRLRESLSLDPNLRQCLLYRPNSSLYRLAGQVRYVEYTLDELGHRHYSLAACEDTEYLKAVLARASGGAHIGAIVDALEGLGVQIEDGREYVTQLIDAQILVSSLECSLTGEDPIDQLVHVLQSASAAQSSLTPLSKALSKLKQLNSEPLGVSSLRYDDIAESLEPLPVRPDIRRLFHVEMHQGDDSAALGQQVCEELLNGVMILQRLSSQHRSGSDSQTRGLTLSEFRRLFVDRYGESEVPLAHVLDDELGIEWGTDEGQSIEGAPLLKGLSFPRQTDNGDSNEAHEFALLKRLVTDLKIDRQEVVLSPDDLDNISVPDPVQLPNAFAVMAQIAAKDNLAVAHGDFRVHIKFVSGASGASIIGRFSSGSSRLRQSLQLHLQAEESLHPDAVFAEVVHLPQGRVGNVLARPVLREFEIPFLAAAGVPADRQIPISDLFVSVVADRIVLRSHRLGREVIPRLSNAHYPLFHFNLRLYRFFYLLQTQGEIVPAWNWGALERFSFLPRVACGRIVLTLARWRLVERDIRHLLSTASSPATRFDQIQQFRKKLNLPRFIVLHEADNELPVDLENTLSIEVLCDLLSKRRGAELREMFPPPDELCATGPDGRYVHEVVVPFVREISGDVLTPPRTSAVRDSVVSPRYIPASEWLYAKIYTGTATADRILRDAIGPLVVRLRHEAMLERWFFIRYADPGYHLRIRFFSKDSSLWNKGLPLLRSALSALVDLGAISRVQLETYEPEVVRYGGSEGMELAEQLFHFDSDATLALLGSGSADPDIRWRVGLLGLHKMLEDFDFDVTERARLLEDLRSRFRTWHAHAVLRKQLSGKLRSERPSLSLLMAKDYREDKRICRALDILSSRSSALKPIGVKFRILEKSGRLTHSVEVLVGHFMHMFLNRFNQSAHSHQEFVLLDMLGRIYESTAAQQRSSRQEQSKGA